MDAEKLGAERRSREEGATQKRMQASDCGENARDWEPLSAAGASVPPSTAD